MLFSSHSNCSASCCAYALQGVKQIKGWWRWAYQPLLLKHTTWERQGQELWTVSFRISREQHWHSSLPPGHGGKLTQLCFILETSQGHLYVLHRLFISKKQRGKTNFRRRMRRRLPLFWTWPIYFANRLETPTWAAKQPNVSLVSSMSSWTPPTPVLSHLLQPPLP